MATSISKLKSLKMTPNPPSEDKPVDDRVRKDWNNFLNDLEKKGFRGKPDLDKGGKGYALFDAYVKENPTTTLSRAMLPTIRKELLSYRNWVLQQNKSTAKGSGKLAEGVTEQNFMKHLVENEKTKDPDYPGMNLTSTIFPDSYLTSFNNGKSSGTINQGFSTIKTK